MAAWGPISFAHQPPSGVIYNNVGGTPSAAALDAVFMNQGQPAGFDNAPASLDLAGLALILNHVAALHVGNKGSLSDVP